MLDEADRVLDVNCEEELRVIFGCLAKMLSCVINNQGKYCNIY